MLNVFEYLKAHWLNYPPHYSKPSSVRAIISRYTLIERPTSYTYTYTYTSYTLIERPASSNVVVIVCLFVIFFAWTFFQLLVCIL